MEKIFDIAKDSEQKWGVIAQGIDGNFEEIERQLSGLVGGESEYTPTDEYNMAINTALTIQAAGSMKVTNPIELKKGKTINVFSNCGSGFYALAKGSNKEPQVGDQLQNLGVEYKGVDAEKEYSYTADEDCFVLVSYKKAFEHSIFIQSKSITNQIDDIKKQRNNYSYFLNFDYDITKVFGEHNQQFYESLDVNDFYSALSISKPDYLNDINYYCYAFKPKRIRVSDNANKVKILITLGEHSGERVGMWAFYNLMKYICENWRNDKNAEILRTLVEFYVIPCHNPWGFNNNSSEAHPFAGRTNYNNVNLNRNYPSMYWRDNRDEPNGDSTMYATGDWGGNSAGSEYETQVFMYFYNKIKPNVSIDIHTGGVTEYGDTCTIETGCKNNALDVITLVARTTTNNLILGNDIYPQSADVCISSAAYVEEMPNEVYFGLQYDWISQYDEDCICTLIECCANPYKIFAPQSPLSYDEKMTQTLKEQMQFEYNLIMRLAKAASEML